MTKELSHKEISKRGGRKTLERHGRDFFVKIGRRGGITNKKNHGPDYYKELSAAGVAARQAKRGNQ